jgi:hypothetical protein
MAQDKQTFPMAGFTKDRLYRRVDERIDCNLAARLRVETYEINCRVVNLSHSGAGVVLGSMLQLPLGSAVVLLSPELGELTSVVRWGADTRFGLEFGALSRQSKNLDKLLNLL